MDSRWNVPEWGSKTMRLNRLTLVNFMSHDHCDLELSGISACSIVGNNGAGKSSLMEAVLWGLFGHAKLSNKDLVRSGQDIMSVKIEYMLNEHEYVVVRQYDHGTVTLKAQIDGHDLGQGTNVLSARLTKDIGLARETLMQSLIISQGQLASFLTSPPSDRRDTIIGALGLDRLIKAGTRARDMLRDAQAELSTKQDTLVSLKTQIDKLTSYEQIEQDMKILAEKLHVAQEAHQGAVVRRERLLAQDEEARKHLDILTNEVAQIREKVAETIKDFDKKIGNIDTSLDNVDQQLAQLDAMRNLLAELQKDLDVSTHAVEQARDLRAKIDQLSQDMDGRKDRLKVASNAKDVCPVCGSTLEADKWQQIIGNMKEELTRRAAELDQVVRLLKDLPLSKDPNTITTRIDQAKERITKTEAMTHTKQLMEDQRDSLIEQKKSMLSQFEHRLQQATSQLEGIQMRVSTEVEVLDTEIKKQKEVTNNLEASLNTCRADKETRRRLEVLYSNEKQKVDYYRANFPQIEFVAGALSPNGIPLMITDYYLPIIEEKAEELLQIMSDGQLHIKLDVVESGRKGIELMAGTDQLRPIRSLSGGEQTRAGLALRLAISQVLFEMAGSRFDCLFVDEPEFLDGIGISQFIQAINNLRGFYSQIFVISHYDQIKFAFPSYISVVKQGDVSSVIIE